MLTLALPNAATDVLFSRSHMLSFDQEATLTLSIFFSSMSDAFLTRLIYLSLLVETRFRLADENTNTMNSYQTGC